jgi:cysteine desulfurase
VCEVTGDSPENVVFTSGATESNNLAILGLAPFGLDHGRNHLVTTAIEHKAVLEPMESLTKRGFELTVVPVDASGRVAADAVIEAVRPNTLLVSVMQVNNETGVRQPIFEIADALRKSDAYFHVDAAQGFGKDIDPLLHERIDLISVSAHKIYGPKGIGALITRRRAGSHPPLAPLLLGGGQERALRPGTLPVPLIVGLGAAAALAADEQARWSEECGRVKARALQALSSVGADLNGDPMHTLAHTLNISIPGVNSEAAMVALKGVAAVSNGSACTSASYSPSHVLEAMGLDESRVSSALRFSWCHMTPSFEWDDIVDRLRLLL